MNGEKFALVLDVFRAHKKQSVLAEAERLGIKLIFVPSCSPGFGKSLYRKIFSIVKSKLRKESLKVNTDENRYQNIHALMNQIWDEISNAAIESAWNIPNKSDLFNHVFVHLNLIF